MKASQSRAYEQKVKISNLQQMTKTIAYVQEHHYDTRESLQMSFEEISEKWKESRKTVKSTEEKLNDHRLKPVGYGNLKNADGKIPSMKSLKAEKEKLTIQRSAQYETYQYFKEYQKELRTVCSNVDSILGQPHLPGTEHSKNLDISK